MTTPTSSSDTPSGGSLIRSTLLAAAVAGALLVTCVLPAEYGIDPTGLGRVLGLTQMGEVKLALAEEAANNAAAEASADSVVAAAEAADGASAPVIASAALAGDAGDAAERVDTTLVTLSPNKGGEVKLVMPGGSRARYVWRTANGVVNYDMHGDSTNAPKDWFVSYKKAQGVAADSGDLVAGFDGNHGWYWRNRGTSDVLVQLITSGTYARIDKHL